MASREKKLIRKPKPLRELAKDVPEGYLSGNLDRDIEELRNTICDAGDLQLRSIYTRGKRRAALFYFEDTVSMVLISQNIIRPLQEYEHELNATLVAQAVLHVPAQSTETEFTQIAILLSQGQAALLLDGSTECLSLKVTEVEHRGIERSESEDVLIGPHDSFSESLGKNLALVRTRVLSPDLKHRVIKVGRVSQTSVAVIYIENIVKPELVDEVLERVGRIDIDFAYGKSITDFICDEPSALMPMLRATERPGRLVAALMEGRVGILTDGDPSVLIAPTFAPEFLQSSEDYFERPLVATFLRVIRFMGLIISIFLPGLWIAMAGFHHGIIPPALFQTIQASREGVPFPTVLEAIVLMVSFDIVVEASTRLPTRIGQALAIVGGIILGQAAVQAGLLSPALVIIVSLTGLAIFTQPSPTTIGPIRLLKYPILAACSVLGLFGLVWSTIFIVIQTVSMRSLGYPFMYPVAPFDFRGELDIFVRIPAFWLNKRPHILSKNVKRMNATPPQPGKGEPNA